MKKVLPVLSAAALMLSQPANLYAADPSQVKTVIDYVREKGVPQVPGSDLTPLITTVTSQQIGYEGNSRISFILSRDFFAIGINDLPGGEEITMIDWNFSGETNQDKALGTFGTIDNFIREEITYNNRRTITQASCKDAHSLGGGMYDTLISLYLKYIGK